MKRLAIILFILAAVPSVVFGQAISEIDGFFKVLHSGEATQVKSQDRTGTCWSYSTTSFIESELLRLGKGTWDLSEMYAVRMIYMDKAGQYLRYQGTTNFSQGSLGHDLLRVYRDHGMMPESAYSGYNGKELHNHSAMEKEMKGYLDSLVRSGRVDPDWRRTITGIMDREMGKIPETFMVNGKSHTPRTFADEVLGLNIDDYVGFTSFTHQPMNSSVVVQVPDNYSRGEYCNIGLDQMIAVMNHALMAGYTIEWDGDVSGGGFNPRVGIALYVPDSVRFTSLEDKPDEHAYDAAKRQKEFNTYTTTDDHLMHITGLAEGADGTLYYITKNSWGKGLSFDGYVMMSEGYVAMKTVCIIVHKDAVPEAVRQILSTGCTCQ